jgi:DNA-binding GntR family transcriptional regulator
VLRRLAELADVYADGDGVIALTQEELAQIAGTSRATVNRVLREQEERGTLTLMRGKTTIVDRELLRRSGPRGMSRSADVDRDVELQRRSGYAHHRREERR